MTTATKAVNYTEEQTAEIVRAYTSGVSLEELATKFAKSTRSVIAKLSREGVYKKKEYKTKTGESAVSKEQLVEQIANVLGKDAENLGGLEKANKETLKMILAYMVGGN